MKTFEVTLPDGSKKRVRAEYFHEYRGALLFFDVHNTKDGPEHFLAGGHAKARSRLMENEFPKDFWTSVVEIGAS
jgi:hypothetical protein